MKTVAEVQSVILPSFSEANGTLVPVEAGSEIPFEIKRLFYVNTVEPTNRGRHAHKQCTQFLVCLHGACDVVCDDGRDRITHRLDGLEQGLLIPPSIWAEQNYLRDGTILMGLCDRLYEPEDYIRDYESFLRWRGAGAA